MNFYTIHTQYGLMRIAQAEAAGAPINLTHAAVGDGNGNATTPSDQQTQLVRERYRTKLNRVYQDPNEPRAFVAELVIPASEGGWTMREIGLYDDHGSLFVVGNLPDTYKPTGGEGAYSDATVRVQFLVSSASVISLAVDPNVAVASQQWVINTFTSAFVIPGGTPGQVLTKTGTAAGAYDWNDPTEANVVVRSIEEIQTLAGNQTVVNLVKTSTVGLAVYVAGSRLRAGEEWTATSSTAIKLTTAYAAGTKIVLAQNDPAGTFFDPVLRAQNLADVPDKEAARDNLGVYGKADVDALVTRVPSGTVAHFAGIAAPTGWMKANGAAISRTAYAALFAAIGTAYGPGDGFTTFNLPDLRGEFIRGWDDGRGVDSGRAIATWQGSQNQEHSHDGIAETAGRHGHPYISDGILDFTQPGYQVRDINPTGSDKNQLTGPAGDHTHKLKIYASGGAEARPRNVAMLAIIKY